MEGPLILPPKRANETSALWDLALAFRHGVKLALDRDSYSTIQYEIDSLAVSHEDMAAKSSTASYAHAPYQPDDDDEYEFDNDNIRTANAAGNKNPLDPLLLGRRMLLAATSHKGGALEYQKPPPPTSTPFQRIKDAMMVRPTRRAGGLQLVPFAGVATTKKASTTTSGGSGVLVTAKVLVDDEEEEDEANTAPKAPSPMESDFYLTLSTICLIGSPKQQGTARAMHPRVAQVTSYAPDCFAELRTLFGITEDEFRKSVLESGPFVSFQSNSKGAARVGGVFFFTRDGAYLIKTIRKDEVQTLLEMLPRYYRFMKQNGRRSLLARFCGMYDVSFRDEDNSNAADASPYTFIVMNSVFPPEASRIITERFDLKGSTVGREATMEERESKGRNVVLKDMDLAREVTAVRSQQQWGRHSSGKSHSSYGIDVGPNIKAALMAQLRRDVQFLVDCQVIDYSLLVGVAKEAPGMNEAELKLLDRVHSDLHKPHQTNLLGSLASAAFLPVRFLIDPSLTLSSKSSSPPSAASSSKSLRSFPQSNFGTGRCVVDTGPLSQILGRRMGNRAIYYFGLIDFLQPFNAKKVIEYRLKSVVYEHGAFSCVPPQEYADRFLAFLEDHII